MSDLLKVDMQVIDVHRNYFVRNKDHSKFFSILKDNRERIVLLNTCHNIIEIAFFTGKYYAPQHSNPTNRRWERSDVDWFGVSYEILDAMFNKYKDDKSNLKKLGKFCMHSKSKTYWLKLKETSFAQEIMASLLGDNIED